MSAAAAIARGARRVLAALLLVLATACAERDGTQPARPRFSTEGLIDAPGSAAPSGEGRVGEIQLVPLGPFVAQLPRRFSEWRYGVEGRTTLVLHRLAGQPPDVWIYARGFPEARPGLSDLAKFLLEVDPEIIGLRRRADQPGANGGGAAGEFAAQISGLATPTLGRGIAYESMPRTFSGWRWVGRNEEGSWLRLARTEGRIVPQRALSPEQLLALRKLGDADTRLAAELDPVLGASPPPPEGSPARMILGSVAASRSGGSALLAIVYRLPEGSAIREAVRALESIRVGSARDRASERQDDLRADINGLAREIGITVVGDEAISAQVGAAGK